MKLASLAVCLVFSGACWSASASSLPVQATPQEAVEQLLATDRAFGAAGAQTTLVPALTAMFAPDVIMQGPGGMMRGLGAATDALNANATNTTATLEWAPVRAGISADGQHGFTYGYMTMTQAGAAAVPLKYLAYWVKRDGRWRVAAYKRRARPVGDVVTTLMTSILPAQLVPARKPPAPRCRSTAARAGGRSPASRSPTPTARCAPRGAATSRTCAGA